MDTKHWNFELYPKLDMSDGFLFFLNQQILLNVIPARRKVWTKQDIYGAAYRRYTITTKQNPEDKLT